MSSSDSSDSSFFSSFFSSAEKQTSKCQLSRLFLTSDKVFYHWGKSADFRTLVKWNEEEIVLYNQSRNKKMPENPNERVRKLCKRILF